MMGMVPAGERGTAMGLIKTGLKAAVAVKVGHMVHDRLQQRQHTHGAVEGQPTGMSSPAGAPQAAMPGAQEHPTPAVPAAGAQSNDVLAQLSKLGELKKSGILTEAEFQAQKARILSG